jgi:hypothetical protein
LRSGGSSFPKKCLHNLSTPSRQNSATNFDPMIHLRVIEQAERGANGSRLRIIRTVNQAADAGVNQSAGAHRARFNCSKQLAAAQAMVAEHQTGGTQRDQLGMRRRVVIGKILIPAAAYQLTVEYHDRPNRHFAYLKSALRRGKGLLHPELVGRTGGASGIDRRYLAPHGMNEILAGGS